MNSRFQKKFGLIGRTELINVNYSKNQWIFVSHLRITQFTTCHFISIFVKSFSSIDTLRIICWTKIKNFLLLINKTLLLKFIEREISISLKLIFLFNYFFHTKFFFHLLKFPNDQIYDFNSNFKSITENSLRLPYCKIMVTRKIPFNVGF